MQANLVSIIMPAYRCRNTLLRAVDSVLAQSYPHWQLIVVVDACPDDCHEVLNAINDERVIVLHNQHNLGVALTRNQGIEYATGQYIAFLDADDYWLPEKLAKQVAVLQAGHDIVFSAYFREYHGGRKVVTIPTTTTWHTMLKSNVIGNLTGIYDADKLGKVLQKNIGHEDYVMWLTLLKTASAVCGIQEPLAVYTVQPSSASANKLRAASWQWRIYRHELGLGFTTSAYYLIRYFFNAMAKRI